MSVSTNAEMRIRGRAPSRLPAQTIERLLSIDLNQRQEERLVTVGHILSSAALGMARGALERIARSPAAADAGFTLLAFSPDFGLMPALGSTPAPWRWRPVELATSTLHHGVYSAATIAAYRWLRRTAGSSSAPGRI